MAVGRVSRRGFMEGDGEVKVHLALLDHNPLDHGTDQALAILKGQRVEGAAGGGHPLTDRIVRARQEPLSAQQFGDLWRPKRMPRTSTTTSVIDALYAVHEYPGVKSHSHPYRPKGDPG